MKIASFAAVVLALCVVGGDVSLAAKPSCKPKTSTPTTVPGVTTPVPNTTSGRQTNKPSTSPTGPTTTPTTPTTSPTGPTTAPTTSPTGPTTVPTTSPTTPTVKPTTPSNNSTNTSGGGNGQGIARFMTESQFKELFPDAIPLYSFQGLVDAVAKFPKFGNSGDERKDKLELAAFFAHLGHESDNFKAAEEYAAPTYGEGQYCDANNAKYKCVSGKRYHGRGPIQLSWNYNYGACGEALGKDLLNNPELVSTDKTITWQTALWYWMTPQKAGKVIHDVVGEDDGFAQSTNIINGGIECQGNESPQEQSRIKRFKEWCTKLNVQPGSKLSCNTK